MRKLMISLCALAMIAAVSGCSSKPEGEGQIEGQRTLTVSTWGLSEDVLVEDVYGPFEEPVSYTHLDVYKRQCWN